MRSMAAEDGPGDANTTIQGKELYELEVRDKQQDIRLRAVQMALNLTLKKKVTPTSTVHLNPQLYNSN